MKAIYLRFHGWRGIGRERQGDLFSCACRLGFATLYICRACLVERLQQLKALAADAERQRRDGDR